MKGSWLVDLDPGGRVSAEFVEAPVPRPVNRLSGRIDDLLTSPSTPPTRTTGSRWCSPTRSAPRGPWTGSGPAFRTRSRCPSSPRAGSRTPWRAQGRGPSRDRGGPRLRPRGAGRGRRPRRDRSAPEGRRGMPNQGGDGVDAPAPSVDHRVRVLPRRRGGRLRRPHRGGAVPDPRPHRRGQDHRPRRALLRPLRQGARQARQRQEPAL